MVGAFLNSFFVIFELKNSISLAIGHFKQIFVSFGVIVLFI